MSALGVVIPGTNITPIVERVFSEKRGDDQLPVIKLGTGLIQSGDTPNDLVVGVISARLADAYKVDLGSSSPAMLNFTGFDGTTKKNRPNLAIGDVVFARVSVANKDMEPELVCFDSENRSEGFGEVAGGMMYACSCNLSQSLQVFDNPVLELLGKNLAFEIVVGANGRFVLNSNKPIDVIRIANILLGSSTNGMTWVAERIREIARSN
ncbi:putative exosome component 3 [Paramicrosporidium saccamoebae]|uniref:Ribosomal RNA-processing protein 40 n=1 Tax=Paramicrosporidium saccamoebae TaxID=1246581 RepID=A0A2H9TJ32_9FUNG|nr:putative exosome component 3 [Paramicrosporidium saccamoebae]